jgi:hypothetical protein
MEGTGRSATGFEAYEPGRRVDFRFTRMPGLEGVHYLEAEPARPGAVVRGTWPRGGSAGARCSSDPW